MRLCKFLPLFFFASSCFAQGIGEFWGLTYLKTNHNQYSPYVRMINTTNEYWGTFYGALYGTATNADKLDGYHYSDITNWAFNTFYLISNPSNYWSGFQVTNFAVPLAANIAGLSSNNNFTGTNSFELPVAGVDPITSNDFVTLGYYERTSPEPITYYLDLGLTATVSYAESGAYRASVTPPITNASITISGITNNQYLFVFAFQEPADVMGAGLYRGEFKVLDSSAGSGQDLAFTWEGYHWTNGFTQGDFEAGANSPVITADATPYIIPFVSTQAIVRATNGAFGIKLKAVVTGTGGAPSITLYTGPDYLSCIRTIDSEGVFVTHSEYNNHASRHSGTGADPITSLGATTMSGALNLAGNNVTNGATFTVTNVAVLGAASNPFRVYGDPSCIGGYVNSLSTISAMSTNDPIVELAQIGNTAVGARAIFFGSRAAGTVGALAGVTNNWQIFSLLAQPYDGWAYRAPAEIEFRMDGTVSSNTAPCMIGFQTGTSSRSERMRITSAGNVGINDTTPSYHLDVNGHAQVQSNLYVTGSTTNQGSIGTGTGFYGPGSVIANPAFCVKQSASQPVTNITVSTVQLNSEDFDIGGYFNTTTYRYTPLVAGYYQIDATVMITNAPNAGELQCLIYKNSSLTARGWNSAGFASYLTSHASTIVQLNGSTDYIELKTYISMGGTRNTFISGGGTQMSGSLVSR